MMTRLLLKLILVLLLWGIFANVLEAKCALEKYIVKGLIASSASRKEIEGARIYVFLDNSEETLAHGAIRDCRDYFESGPDGTFRAVAYFDPTERYFLFGHICGKRPRVVEVMVVKKGFLTFRGRYVVGDGARLEIEGEERVIIVPTIALEPCS